MIYIYMALIPISLNIHRKHICAKNYINKHMQTFCDDHFKTESKDYFGHTHTHIYSWMQISELNIILKKCYLIDYHLKQIFFSSSINIIWRTAYDDLNKFAEFMEVLLLLP